VVFYSINAKIYNQYLQWHIKDFWKTVIPVIPVCFFLLVVIINLNNWCFYYFKIGDMARASDLHRPQVKHTKTAKTIINALTIFYILLTLGYSFYICLFSILHDTNEAKTT
jgi:hypothetical protein